jgi:S-adenosylmethionine synthetase
MMILMKNQSCLLKLKDIVSILIPRIIAKYPAHAPLFNDAIKYHINPTGKFVIGGPHGTQDLQEEKSLLIRMEEKELTVVVLSLERSK